MRKRKRIWTLLYKYDKAERHRIWKYEKLRKKEIDDHLKHGWRILK